MTAIRWTTTARPRRQIGCAIYSHAKGPQAIIEFTRAMIDHAGNLIPQPGIFPDDLALIVREAMAENGQPLDDT